MPSEQVSISNPDSGMKVDTKPPPPPSPPAGHNDTAAMKILILTGPSGAGKSTLKDKLLKKYPHLFEFSVSHTTRKPRPKSTRNRGIGDPEYEQDGIDYWFVDKKKFEQMIQSGDFFEHAIFSNEYYGTSFAALNRIASSGKICLLDIEQDGVRQARLKGLPVKVLLIAPPSLDILKQRLLARRSDDEAALKRRLDRAAQEMTSLQTSSPDAQQKSDGLYDHIIINDDLDETFQKVEELCLTAFNSSPTSTASSSFPPSPLPLSSTSSSSSCDSSTLLPPLPTLP